MTRTFLILVFTLFIGSVSAQSGNDEWLRFDQEPVVVRYHKKDVKNAATVMKVIQEELPRIAGDLRLDTVKGFTVIIASSEQEFHSITGGEIPEWGIGAADPLQGVLFIKSPRFSHRQADLKKVVIHELSHVLLGMVLGDGVSDRWFDEGFALYESGELGLERTVNLARSLFTGEFLNLDQIEYVMSFRHERASLAYQESRSAVDYFIKLYGKDAFADIAWMLNDGKKMEEAFYQALGVDLGDFENQWIQTLRRRYFLYPFLQFPYILSGAFLALFIAAIIVTKVRTYKKKALWDQEENHEIGAMEQEGTTSN
jgi:hypothetical protein